ncbi:hypothetical protein Dtox_3909 [Desulfofarcimen acetoxidans DSM 771]|uniref:Uncharacterized protein n=1 Tax=Desulfofarcimen acetoxidans (strain ATCC 49208 / DSM 771 / KCTC 5769 / VKM B-1644 / 5575) TaxID=485916 RepID=C8VXX3_DESAS|nr:hypothetical protein [Desulfofarcimen acetoxidans]ACV64602.1 hypothetical protein Dtox_3909 [Desulfofarcimen acetoxidans DSM 771]
MAKIPKTKKQRSLFTGLSNNNKAKQDEQDSNSMFLFSLKDLDREQGQSLIEWEKEGILARAFELIRNYCCSTLTSQSNTDKFTVYGDFPPKNVTEFFHPKHIPDDALWARIHITGKQCIIGHVVRNVFYVVFLDKDHEFYKSKLKHT